jgi:hypothetical protein
VAREFVRYGQLPRARSILHAEGILAGTSDLTPFEYIVALQCGTPCLTAEEFSRLGQLAREDLQRANAAGLLGKYAEEFSTRLGKFVDTSGLAMDAPAPDTAPEHDEESMWRSLHNELERLQQNRQIERERQFLNNRFTLMESQFDFYCLWGWIFDQFDSDIGSIYSLRPDVSEAETPISRATPAVTVRARVLAELWRRHLLAEEPSARQHARDEIRRFMAQERDLDDRWLQQRSAAIKNPTERLGNLANIAANLLATIQRGETKGNHWPFFLRIEEATRADTDRLIHQLAERVHSVGAAQEAHHA